MPILDEDISLPKNVQLWEIKEPWKELVTKFDQNSKITSFISTIKNEARKQQFLASRLLIQNQFKNWETVKNENGKPSIKSSKVEISITHDKSYAGIIYSNKSCGIDIQEISQKVIKIKDKFINQNDAFYDSKNEKELTTIWCAKEALYKVNGIPEIFFKDHMIIEPTKDNNVLVGKIIHPEYSKEYKMRVHFIKNYCLVYTL